LIQTTNFYQCTNLDCVYSNSLAFPVVGNYPVLVDFEQSILSKEEILANSGKSVIQRSQMSTVKQKILELFFPKNTVADKNVNRLQELLKLVSEKPMVLVVGGASLGNGTDALYNDSDIQLISFDIYGTPLTQFIADAHQIPVADQSVDAVWIQAVLEHVLDPWLVVTEIYRVLKKEGFVYAETPFMQQVHEGPYDFTRFTESGHRWLFKNFELIDSGVVLGSGTQFMWTIEHIMRGIFRSLFAGRIASLLLFWVHYLDKIIPQSYSIDNASAVFFLGRKSEKTLHPKDMVSYYQGAERRLK
jgi:SAM-dependent methyltransferase